MSRYSQTLQEVFDAYGADAESALAAYANIDPEGWSLYADSAAEKQYLSDYRNHRRSLTRSVEKEALASVSGQARLFEVPPSTERVELRRILILDGEEHDLATLAGHEGSSIARKVAERDLAPSLTTLNRCRFILQVADHVDAETERIGRPVSFAEVLGWAA